MDTKYSDRLSYNKSYYSKRQYHHGYKNEKEFKKLIKNKDCYRYRPLYGYEIIRMEAHSKSVERKIQNKILKIQLNHNIHNECYQDY